MADSAGSGSDGHFCMGWRGKRERREGSRSQSVEGRERTTKLALLLVCDGSQELQDVFVCVCVRKCCCTRRKDKTDAQ